MNSHFNLNESFGILSLEKKNWYLGRYLFYTRKKIDFRYQIFDFQNYLFLKKNILLIKVIGRYSYYKVRYINRDKRFPNKILELSNNILK